MALNILIVDDHQLLRDGIKAILRDSPEFKVMAEADNGTEAVRICKTTRPDMVLMDIGLPGLGGIETITEILRHQPGLKVIILSIYDDEQSVVAAIRSGVRAFVVKNASGSDLIDALRAVAQGGSYFSPKVSGRLLERIHRDTHEADLLPTPLAALSRRELQVLRLVAEGKASKEIAVLLDLGLQTIRGYRKSMMKKLGINNAAGLTQLALACGITHFPVHRVESGPG